MSLDEGHLKDLKLLQSMPQYISLGAFAQLILAGIVLVATLIYALRINKVDSTLDLN